MRIVHAVANLAAASGGPSRVIPAMAAAAGRAGGEVTLVIGDDGREAIAPPPGLDVRLVPVPGWTAFGRAIGAALAPPPALLHDHGIWTAANRTATGTARARGVPYLVSVHGMLEPWALAHHGGRKRVAWAAYQRRSLVRAAALVASAGPEQATLRAKLPRVPVALIPNGVDVPAAMHEARPADGPRTLLFLSRLHPVKNLPGLLDAWAEVTADPAFDDWTLRIAGPDEGGHAAVVAAKVAALGLGARVTLDGPVDDAAKGAAFAAADLFVLPSFTENFGIVVAEALAHGVPVVASSGTPWAALVAERCGWHAADGTLAATLKSAMRLEAAERMAMGLRGRAFVAREFGWDAIGARLLGVYEWVLNGGGRPDCVDG